MTTFTKGWSYSLSKLTIALLSAGLLLTGCADKSTVDKTATDATKQTALAKDAVAAIVNGKKITVQQVEDMIPPFLRPDVDPERAQEVKNRILNQLILERLVVDAAYSNKLEQKPEVKAELDRLKDAVLTRAFQEDLLAQVNPPSEAEVKIAYDNNENIYKNNTRYFTRQIVVRAPMDELPSIAEQAEKTGNAEAFLKSIANMPNVRVNEQPVMYDSALLPPMAGETLKNAKVGTVMTEPSPRGLTVIEIIKVEHKPIDYERAKPVLEHQILLERQQQLFNTQLQKLRQSAKVEYKNDFSEVKIGEVIQAAEQVERAEAADSIPSSIDNVAPIAQPFADDNPIQVTQEVPIQVVPSEVDNK